MIVTYLRSSSIGTLNQCEMKYFGEYVLDIRGEPRQKTVMGSMFHKVMEALYTQKLTTQNFKKTCEIAGLGKIKITTPVNEIICKSFDYYAKLHSEYTWEDSHLNDLSKWVDKCLTMEGGQFDPSSRHVLEVEKFFDITLEEDWAHYQHYLDGQIEGQISLKGTIDLVVEHDDYVELIDWKTGARKNWVSGATKDYDDFKKDNQLLLYYWVAHHFYQKPICVTIVYVNSGGSYTMDFDESDYEKAYKMIKEMTLRIKNIKKPQTIRPHSFCSFCPLFKTEFDNPLTWPDGNHKDKCHQLKSEIYSIGLAATTQKYMKDKSHIYNYTEGGGKENDKK